MGFKTTVKKTPSVNLDLEILKVGITCVAVTPIPHPSSARWTTIGLAGAPLGVVSANQYVITGHNDLLITVGSPSGHC